MPPTHRGEAPPAGSIERAASHLGDVLALALEHGPSAAALVVWDGRSELARLLRGAYQRCLPAATFLEFDALPPAEILGAFERLAPGDLVVLIQSTSFRLDAYRIRLELFRRGLAVIEHPHLARMSGPDVALYVEALAYDPGYYRGTGAALKERIDRARTAVIEAGGERLVFSGGLEPAKRNVGDYRELPNRGGQFPIGEVFTESRNLAAVDGRVKVAFFGNRRFEVERAEPPATLVVAQGRVTDALDASPELAAVLAEIRADEGEVRLRELGFGLNRALSPRRVLRDIGTFERMCGVHLSLGAKHASYAKPEIDRSRARHHVDVFLDADGVWLDGERVFQDGAWTLTGGSSGPDAPALA